jgi:hypothetical protein
MQLFKTMLSNARSKLLSVTVAAMAAAVLPTAHAGAVFDFENVPLGSFTAPSLDLGYGLKVGNAYASYPGFPTDTVLGTIKGFNSACSGSTCPAANTGHYFSTEESGGMTIYGGSPNLVIASLDIAVLQSATFNGVAAADYMVQINGFTIFPEISARVVQGPSTGAFQFSHVNLTDLTAGPYGTSGITVTAYACAKAGCVSTSNGQTYYADGQAYRCDSAVCGNAADFVRVSAAIDNVYVSSVPEPSTYGMLVVGLMGVGALARRRRNS